MNCLKQGADKTVSVARGILKSSIFNYLYKFLVFLIFLTILLEYQKSNQLRTEILSEVKQFNIKLADLNEQLKLDKREDNLKLAAMMWGSNIWLGKGGSDDIQP